MKHFVSKSCEGERCICGKPATHKVGEEIPHDDPFQARHNLTQYVCCRHFAKLFPAAKAVCFAPVDYKRAKAVA